jgi:hypothetical protein
MIGPLVIDRRPSGRFFWAAGVRLTTRRPTAGHVVCGLYGRPLHAWTFGVLGFGVALMLHGPAPDATATAGAGRSGARP